MTFNVTIPRRPRRDLTDAERALWSRLRDRHLAGLKFRRQVALGPYVVDFCCESARLVIEVDGGLHAGTTDEDLNRTMDLEAMGYLVLRFWNNDVLKNVDGVVESILGTLRKLPSVSRHPNPLSTGEREQS